MGKKMGIKLFKSLSEETGAALIIVLILLMLGSLTIVPVLVHIGTALKTGQLYEDKTDRFYAADAGIEDAIWRIKYDCIDPNYNPYDFDTTWEYNLDDQVNNLMANVSIKNVWMPSNVEPPTDPTATEEIIKKNKLMIAGTASTSDTTYKIIVNFYPEGSDNLTVDSIGIWLPHGFSYVTGSSNLEEDIFDPYYATANVTNHAGGWAVVWEFSSVPFTDFPGVVADDSPQATEITFTYTPEVSGTRPATISWLETDDYVIINDILPVTWDIDTRIFEIHSIADGTEVEAYSSRCELRKMVDAIAGDYKAIGNTMMTDGGDSDNYRDSWVGGIAGGVSSITVNDIPNTEEDGYADVIAAYLYWSGWFNESSKQTITYDNCSDADNWTLGGCWSVYNNDELRGSDSDGGDQAKLTLTDSLDLTPYEKGTVLVFWDQREYRHLENNDGLDFAFSGDGGNTWSDRIEAFRDDNPLDKAYVIPDEYHTSEFKIEFYVVGCTDSQEYVYIDDIRISQMVADDKVTLEIDNLQPEPDYSDEVSANKTQVLPNSNGDGSPNGFSYSSYADVTNLVQTYAEKVEDAYENEYHTGNALYTVRGVNGNLNNAWSYAGWSLVIIYASPKTAGHQLYLYDDFMYSDEYTCVDFDDDGEMGGTISGFVVPEPIAGEVNAATITCFVGEGDEGNFSWGKDFLAFNAPEIYRINPWSIPNDYKLWDGKNAVNNSSASPNNVWNSKSLGLTADGVDIDTFHVTWASGLLSPGDTSAHIDLPTELDSWNLVYIILSFRSKTVIGGTTHYVIYNG